MKSFNIPLLIASVLTTLAFFLHMIGGDIELRLLRPTTTPTLQIWTMARCGWHWISLDLLMVSIGLFLATFTKVLQHRAFVLKLLSIYFIGYGVVWLLIIVISTPFDQNYLALGQWILLIVIGSLVHVGRKRSSAEPAKYEAE